MRIKRAKAVREDFERLTQRKKRNQSQGPLQYTDQDNLSSHQSFDDSLERNTFTNGQQQNAVTSDKSSYDSAEVGEEMKDDDKHLRTPNQPLKLIEEEDFQSEQLTVPANDQSLEYSEINLFPKVFGDYGQGKSLYWNLAVYLPINTTTKNLKISILQSHSLGMYKQTKYFQIITALLSHFVQKDNYNQIKQNFAFTRGFVILSGNFSISLYAKTYQRRLADMLLLDWAILQRVSEFTRFTTKQFIISVIEEIIPVYASGVNMSQSSDKSSARATSYIEEPADFVKSIIYEPEEPKLEETIEQIISEPEPSPEIPKHKAEQIQEQDSQNETPDEDMPDIPEEQPLVQAKDESYDLVITEAEFPENANSPSEKEEDQQQPGPVDYQLDPIISSFDEENMLSMRNLYLRIMEIKKTAAKVNHEECKIIHQLSQSAKGEKTRLAMRMINELSINASTDVLEERRRKASAIRKEREQSARRRKSASALKLEAIVNDKKTEAQIKKEIKTYSINLEIASLSNLSAKELNKSDSNVYKQIDSVRKMIAEHKINKSLNENQLPAYNDALIELERQERMLKVELELEWKKEQEQVAKKKLNQKLSRNVPLRQTQTMTAKNNISQHQSPKQTQSKGNQLSFMSDFMVARSTEVMKPAKQSVMYQSSSKKSLQNKTNQTQLRSKPMFAPMIMQINEQKQGKQKLETAVAVTINQSPQRQSLYNSPKQTSKKAFMSPSSLKQKSPTLKPKESLTAVQSQKNFRVSKDKKLFS